MPGTNMETVLVDIELQWEKACNYCARMKLSLKYNSEFLAKEIGLVKPEYPAQTAHTKEWLL